MYYPYSDDFMIFNEESKRYELTPNCVEKRLGLSLEENVNERNAINQQIALKRILKQVSNLVYSYIHKFNYRTDLQDYIISKVPSARIMIQEAMEEQLLYMSMKGDLSRSTEKDKREFAIDETTKEIVSRVLPELGISIIYTGDLARCL